jgi:hypothetical protein
MSVSYDDLFPSRFLKAEMLTDEFNTFCIKDVYVAELETEDKKIERKAVIAFSDCKYELTLAKVNGEAIKAMFGRDVKNWIGKRVTLWSTNTIMPFPKKPNDPCVRVFGSPDIDREVVCAWTPPRKREIVMRLQPTVHPRVKAALDAAASGTPADKIAAGATKLRDKGELSDPDLQQIMDAIAAPQPSDAEDPVQAPAEDPAQDADEGDRPVTEAELQELVEFAKTVDQKVKLSVFKELAAAKALPLAKTKIGDLVATKAELERIYAMLRGEAEQ